MITKGIGYVVLLCQTNILHTRMYGALLPRVPGDVRSRCLYL
jgi:hypothetical protein